MKADALFVPGIPGFPRSTMTSNIYSLISSSYGFIKIDGTPGTEGTTLILGKNFVPCVPSVPRYML
jgi:hypothetical protein